MPRQLHVHFLPSLTSQHELAGETVVVIDVLRASTTIAFALAAGAKEVIPCLHVADARELKKRLGDQAVLGGEREGVKIEGFELGNSPREYVEDVVAGKTVIFTTTNGTRALQACVGAGRVIIGSFVNLSTVCEAVRDDERVHIVCAGTRGQITREDLLVAGAMSEQLYVEQLSLEMNDSSQIALDAWQTATGGNRDAHTLARCMKLTQGGRNLQEIGMAGDIRLAAALDMVPVLPELEISAWSIRAATVVF